MSVVRDNTDLNRFEMDTEAGFAIADYRLNGFTMTIYHTEVPARLRGRGHGGRLVTGALSQARSKGYKIVPSCWFVREVMSASSKYDDLWADRMPNSQQLGADLIEEGHAIPIARAQAMHEGKRRARARRGEAL